MFLWLIKLARSICGKSKGHCMSIPNEALVSVFKPGQNIIYTAIYYIKTVIRQSHVNKYVQKFRECTCLDILN